MKQLQRFSSTLAVLTLALVLVAGPVSAQNGANDSITAENSASTETTRKSDRSVATTQQVTETEQQTPESSTDNADLHKRGDDNVAKLRKEHADDKVKTPAQRQKACEAHKKGLQTKFKHIVSNSQRAQTRITSIFDKAVAFQNTSNIQAVNFDSLVEAAEAAKATSVASITALQAVTPTVDCNNVSVASDVATFKAAAETTRTNLKAYKSAVKAVLKSLEAAKPANDTEGSN